MLRATFRQLQTFIIVAETGSFAAAATRLGVSPAAVSDQIRALETKFSCKLFSRRPGTNPLLNDKGAALLRKVPELLTTAEEVENLSAAPSPERATVGAGDYILEHLFLPKLARFQAAHPSIHIEFIRLTSSQEAMEAVSANRLDLAYVALYAGAAEARGELIGISRPLLFVSPAHPLSRGWTADSKRKLPMIMPLAGSFLERMIVQILADAGIYDFDVVTRAQHPDTIISLAAAGVGVGCLMREHAHNALTSGTLVSLNLTLPPLYRFAFRRENALEQAHLRELDAFALGIIRDDLLRANANGSSDDQNMPRPANSRRTPNPHSLSR